MECFICLAFVEVHGVRVSTSPCSEQQVSSLEWAQGKLDAKLFMACDALHFLYSFKKLRLLVCINQPEAATSAMIAAAEDIAVDCVEVDVLVKHAEAIRRIFLRQDTVHADVLCLAA